LKPWFLSLALVACQTSPPSPPDALAETAAVAGVDVQADGFAKTAAVDGGVAAQPDAKASPKTCTSNLSCNDNDKCTVDTCPSTGSCVYGPTLCFDGNPCTDDKCSPPAGCQYLAQTCDDGDPCTQDSCYPNSGCYWQIAACTDDNPCTTDTCSKGKCVGVAVADGAQCLTGGGACQAGLCATKPCPPGGFAIGSFALGPASDFVPSHLVPLTGGLLAMVGWQQVNGGDVANLGKVRWITQAGATVQETPINANQSVQGAVRAADGALLLCGQQSNPGTLSSAWFGRASGPGPLVNVPLGDPYVWCQRMTAAPDGDAFIGGVSKVQVNVASTAYVARVNFQGKLAWAQTLAAGQYNLVTALAGAGALGVTAAVNAKQADSGVTTIHRYDLAGASVWQTNLDTAKTGAPLALLPKSGGAVTVVAVLYGKNAVQGLVTTRISASGKVQWSQLVLPAVSYALAHTLEDGSTVLAYSAPLGPQKGIGAKVDRALARLDTNDNLQFTYAMPAGDATYLTAIASLPDGRLAQVGVVGLIDPQHPPKWNTTWFGFANPWGHLSCAEAGKCAGVKTCDDGDPCTADNCLPATGCSHVALAATSTCTTP